MKETSRKAKKSAEQNTDPSHVGHCGFSGWEPHVESRWNQLVSSYPILDLIQDDRSKMYTVSRAPFNPVTKLYELSEHFVSEGELKGTLKKLSIQKCELLDPYDQGAPTVIGMGHVHPSPERIIHNGPIIDGFVKVQIDRVVEGCEGIRLLPESCIPVAVEFLEDAKGNFVQWPAKSIKFADKQFSHNTIEHVSFSKPDEPVRACKRTEPVVASNPLKEKTKVSKEKTKVLNLLEKARARPQSIYELAQQLAIQSDKALSIVFTSLTGMYEERIEETVEFEAVIQLCVNDWIDACFVHWFTMYLYATGGQEGLNNTAYFHPRYIEGGLVSDDVEFVIDHIRNVISFHKDKQWFMAPHIAGSFSYACSKH
ncbi:hypothetical protein HanRHA438_Chr04g0155801 [Helianthus annuus]|nr:hypothetical protein HanIR_Chr04g0156791 [Helianthus annuus]KAJ0925099.1 hypothetical protein HanRHA438_Chr04g0155801 [Helianthus annuus]